MTKSKTIVLIHGNFVNELTWAGWKSRFEQKGYIVHAPANPGHEGLPAALRAQVHPQLTKTGFVDVVQNIEALIATLPEKPLIIGHSMAGMATMKLLELGKAAAAISIDGAPPKNIFPGFATVKAVLPAFGFFSSQKFFMGSRQWYDHCFFNTLPEGERIKAFDQIAVPESFKVSRQLVLDSYSNIDFGKPHSPILFIGGGEDHIFPASLTKKIAGSYRDRDSRVDLKIFAGKSHFICGEPGWEEVADYCLDWYEKL